MENKLRFEILEDTGSFVYPTERFASFADKFGQLLEAYQSNKIGDKRYITGLIELTKAEPDFIDSYAHLSFAFYEQGKPKKALDAALAGLAVGNRLIPEGFNGFIEWHFLDNRPFLRALQGAILAYMRLRRHKEVVSLIDKMFAYNPNDNQGMRYLLGSEALRAADKVYASKIFNEYADDYPPYHYELALLYIINNDWISAATALRRGFCANGYIAEILCGNFHPQPLAIWHGSDLAMPDIAGNYIEMYGDLWFRHPEALAFIRWLFNHSSVMTERALLMKCNEELLCEWDPNARGHILSRQQALMNEIDNKISIDIVKKIKDADESEIWPWMLTSG